MKLALLATIAATAITSASACLQTKGNINLTNDGPKLQYAWLTDNGSTVCNSANGYGLSTSGFSINCQQGYRMIVSSDGHSIWYYTPHGDFRWNQQTTGGNSPSWETWQYC